MRLRLLQRRAEGFTLIELLVAVSLLLLIATMSFGSFAFARRSLEANLRAEEAARVEAVRTFLRREIAAALPLPDSRPDEPLRLAFVGRADSLEFVAVLPARTMKAGVYRIRLTAEPNPAGDLKLQALRSVHVSFRRGIQPSAPDHRLLLNGATHIRFRYFGHPSENEPAAWFADWPSTTRLPVLVEMSIGYPVHSLSRWPDLSIRLRLAGRP